MTQDEIIGLVNTLPGVVVQTANEAGGALEIAWGDTFIYYDSDDNPSSRRMPFATIVTKDYPGFDTESNLNRPEVFRLNINVGRAGFEELSGYPPASHPDYRDNWDYSTIDTILPHPVYAAQGWICIVHPGPATASRVASLLANAYLRAARRQRPHA